MKEKIRQIKYARLKPEERYLVNILNNLVLYKSQIRHNVLYYKCNDILVFEHHIENNFFRSYIDMSKFNLNWIQSNYLIKQMIAKYLDIKNVTVYNIEDKLSESRLYLERCQ
jgi:hypothetical protein